MAKYSYKHNEKSSKPNIYFDKGTWRHQTQLESSVSDYYAAIAFCDKLNNAAPKRGLKA